MDKIGGAEEEKTSFDVMLTEIGGQKISVIKAVREIASGLGVDFVKTSTGYNPAGGATVEAVTLMAQSAPACKVKASGGIRTAEQALAMIEAGASRIGTSSSVAILEGFQCP